MIKAELIDHMGDDLRVVDAARVSFDKQSEWEFSGVRDNESVYELYERDARLIHYLAKHDHFTPFTHCTITMRESVPIFVARQRFKHVVGFTYNEVSRRYVDENPEFYTPEIWRKRADDKKQGSSSESIGDGTRTTFPAGDDGEPVYYSEFIGTCLSMYETMLKAGVAPEQARMVLPQSMMTSYYCTGSLYAFARAYRLRSQADAQVEIQNLASQWDRIIRPLYPVSWEALSGSSMERGR